MKHTESTGKIGRRCAFVLVLFSLVSCLFIWKFKDIWVCFFIFLLLSFPFFCYISCYYSPFLSVYFNFQVAAAVRNRSIEMVEALYNMNRVNQYYGSLVCSHVA